MARKDWESLRQKRQTKFQQGQKRAGKVQGEQKLLLKQSTKNLRRIGWKTRALLRSRETGKEFLDVCFLINKCCGYQ